jgi:2-alkyl-3-oxoalkanoate reductase
MAPSWTGVKVFLAGATGAIGRPLLRELIAAGHDVTGMTRSTQKAGSVAAAGAEPVVCDALDAASVERAMRRSAPDVVVHQLTALPRRYNPRRLRELYRDTDRLHVEGTDNLIAAARATGAGKFVVQSIAFAYARTGGRVKREDDPLDAHPPKALTHATAALLHLERAARQVQLDGLDSVVLRYGFFYGPATWYAPDGHFANEIRRRRYPIVGRGEGVCSFVHVEDAATATRLAIEQPVTGTFNIVDDDPAALKEWVPVFADAVNAPKPWRVPAWAARLIAGRSAVEQLSTLRGADNTKAKTALGWEMCYPTWRDGFARQSESAVDGRT